MTSVRSLRRWAAIHKWTSLVCTLFLLLFCLTGLPLIFEHELRELMSDDPPYATLPDDAPRADLDTLVAAARRRHPTEFPLFVFVDDDEPKVVVGMLPSPTAPPAAVRRLKFDARSGALLVETEAAATRGIDFLEVMLRLHRDLFAGLPGELFLGAMGLMFVVAIVSGVVLYLPFMRRLDFGTVRWWRGRRLRWLDLHNLLGVVTVAWALVVGVTGIVNELSRPLFLLFQRTDVQAMLLPYRGQPVPSPDRLASVQVAYALVQRDLPGRTPTSIVFPNDRIGSPHHYLVWTKGSSALTSRLLTPVLIDAERGALAMVVELPWYLRALQVSRPLHFGDYGGLPLKIIWAVLDLITIVVLASGLYLWLSRRRSPTVVEEAEIEAEANGV
jgi:uncharacterized iron-regulated membrane protein